LDLLGPAPSAKYLARHRHAFIQRFIVTIVAHWELHYERPRVAGACVDRQARSINGCFLRGVSCEELAAAKAKPRYAQSGP